MPKITKHGGATNVVVPPVQSETKEETPEWPGNSSSASTESKPTNSTKSEAGSRKPAPTTENRSAKGRTARSSARSTGGSGRETAE